MDKIRIGILYDFDKTLCTTDMQEYDFIKKLGMTSDAFWGEAAAITEQHEVEKILAYMFVMIKKCKEKGIKGKETTPFLLARVSELTGGDSLSSNIRLVFNNARVAALTAVEYCK